ncbi:MAG: translation elongation factor Ts [Planctomycetota bacterium]
MAEITASAVKELREKTGLPMMDCKKALTESQGDMEKAIERLRILGRKVQEKQADRSTSTGRIAIFSELEPGAGALIDLRCESAPVANNEHFISLANDLAQQLAKGPGAATPDELLDQPSPSQKGTTLRQQFDDLNNRIREKFVLQRILRVAGPTAGYVHHNGAVAVLLQVENASGAAELARDICMHIAAMKPVVLHKEDLDPASVAKEHDVLDQAMTQEAETIKNEAERVLALPDQQIQDPNNLERMTSSHSRARGDQKKTEGMAKNKAKVIEGRLNVFYAERCLLEQPHANQAKYDSKKIAELAKTAGMKINGFFLWELSKE